MTTGDPLAFEFDQFQRYSFLARALRGVFGEDGPRSHLDVVRILDVGSGAERLTEAFLGPRFEVTRCDVSSFGDEDVIVIEPGQPLPFGASQFDAVLVLEVLEHIPAPARERFIGECIRVARDLTVFSSPVPETAVVDAENRIARAFEAHNRYPHPFLSEHAEMRPPNAETVVAAIEQHGAAPVVAAAQRLDLWEAFLMLDQLLRTVPGGQEIAADVCRFANRGSFPAAAEDAHYRNFYLAIKERSLQPLISETVRSKPPELDKEPRDPLYQLAKWVASYLSERSRIEDATTARLHEVEMTAQSTTARLHEVEMTAQSLGDVFFKVKPRAERQSVLRRLFGAATVNAPFVAEAYDGLVNLIWGGHSVWVLARGDASLSCQGAFSAGRYELRARVAAPGGARLELATDDLAAAHVAEVGPDVSAVVLPFELARPAKGLTISVRRTKPGAVIGDLHFVKLLEEGARGRVLGNAVSRIKGSPTGARLVQSPVGRFLHRVVGPLPPLSDSYDYSTWIETRVASRGSLYAIASGPLLSLLTSVWNTPPEYLHALHATVAQQDWLDFEWIVLDNGSNERVTVAALEELSQDERVRFFRVDENRGIVGGMRYCLERASADYVLPLDSDDLLYPDALRIMSWHIEQAGRPPLLYSDEDKMYDGRRRDPYFKPGWDPVLFLNSCYIAHLCAIDRSLALELRLYSDAAAEGCHDWDSFIRFMLAGHTPVHVPEVLYSWRMHGASAALNIESKPYLVASHQHVLGRFLAAQHAADRFQVAPSPLFNGTPDWWFRRDHSDARPLLSIVLGSGAEAALPRTSYPRHSAVAVPLSAPLSELSDLIRGQAEPGALVQLVAAGVELEGDEWPWEAIALMELHPDTAMVAGRVFDQTNRIVAAGEYFGFGGDCGCPDVGRAVHDPGYFAQMWSQRSVSAASTILTIADSNFLDDALDATPADATLRFFGAWAGAYAARTQRRVVYSPHISGRGRLDRAAWDREITSEERAAFTQQNADLIPELRFLSPMLSLAPNTVYEPMSPDAAPRGYAQLLRRLRPLDRSGVD
jgi:Glycosyl transferase family 2/Methyltransferase domain